MIKLKNTYFILRNLITCLIIIFPLVLHAQQKPVRRTVPAFTPRSATPSSATVTGNSVVVDTVRRDSLTVTNRDSVDTGSNLQTTVNYSAKDSTLFDATGQIVELFGDAKVDYGDIHLTAAYIKLNWTTNEVYARGRYDSTARKTVGLPVFQDASGRYDTQEIRFNFKTKKGFIKGVITAQGEGNVRGKTVKKDAQDNLYIRNAIYTTCNLATPHFHINASKIKVVHNKQLISGPFNLVINDIPTPLALPFGFFPIPKKSEIGTSGLIFPQYGEEPNGRGFYLRDGGYYFAINQYISMSLRGQIYSNGSWGLGLSSEYLKRYRYGGNFALTYARNRTTSLVDTASKPRNDFSIIWSHSPRPRGNSQFSANVNVSSNSYNQLNTSLSSGRYVSNAANSGVNYSHKFGQYVTSSANLNVSQNFGRYNPATNVREGGQTNISSGFNLGVAQIAPFALKGGTGRWFESFRLGLDFNAQATLNNTRRTVDATNLGFPVATTLALRGDTLQRLRDSLAAIANQEVYINSNLIPMTLENLPTILKNAQVQSRYSIPISLPNFKLARYLNFTPGVSLSGDVYTKSLEYTYLPDRKAVRVDTSNRISATYFLSFNASMNTRAYGTFFMRLGRLEAIRHTIAPSISFSYTPDLSSAFTTTLSQYRDPFDTTKVLRVSRYRGLGGTAGASSFTGRSASISYSIVNQLEMKVRSRSDSAKSEFEKVSLFDNISLSGSYNPYAPQFKFSTLNFSANTQIFKKVSFNFSSVFDPYAYANTPTVSSVYWVPDQSQYFQTGPYINAYHLNKIDKLAITQGQGLAHLQNLNFYLSTQFAPKEARKPKVAPNSSTPTDAAELRNVNKNPEDYVDFNIPWSINLSYTFSLTKFTPIESQIIQALQVTGDLSLTPKWKVSLQTGFDFSAKAPSLTTVTLHRDLHCWDMNFSYTPFSGNRYRSNFYSFDLRVKSAILQDLKLSRRRGTSINY
ncbi:putative LPS assembly protein LptD [Larkinella knui]|uniref:putative LPS assembly protein LptD n=1 Tax=Larkinella knui TaxID=2025310 RepID=UPI001E50F954|nr:putative LPS assembly protein LptD [Larkinella knui]